MGLSELSVWATAPELKSGTGFNRRGKVIALGGNPNVGKSTVFNRLTGMRQHTGNWPGKTVSSAVGRYVYMGESFLLVDIPGMYSFSAGSEEEELARDFICFGSYDAIVMVADATCLERNLILVLKAIEVARNVVVCVNLMDEARKKKIEIDLDKLSHRLGVPVVGTSARSGKGLDRLMEAVYKAAFQDIPEAGDAIRYDLEVEQAVLIVEPRVRELLGDRIKARWAALKLLEGDRPLLAAIERQLGVKLTGDPVVAGALEEARNSLARAGVGEEELKDRIAFRPVKLAEEICKETVTFQDKNYGSLDRKIDKILTSRAFGIPAMLLFLGLIFWITIRGANYPSEALSAALFWLEGKLSAFFMQAGAPLWLHGLLVEGVYRTVAWVVSVMLPPMAIFFPLFTLLEDLGYLPRVAFNLDSFFRRARAHGKQALTMCMGFGCNAVGVMGCRIIDSPRERLIAVLTNNFVPCNGRFPTLFALSAMFFTHGMGARLKTFLSAAILLGIILFSVAVTLGVSRLLSATVLKGLSSSFILELSPYRKPQVGRVILRSVFDRTLFVLGRAVCVAAPAGAVIWILANVRIGCLSLLDHCAGFLDPFAGLMGMDGYILMAFLLAFPANETLLPVVIMSYLTAGSMCELSSLGELRQLFISRGWTFITALNVMLFSLMHFPCSTTCWTIKKETGSFKWTAAAFFLPTAAGVAACIIVALLGRLFGLHRV